MITTFRDRNSSLWQSAVAEVVAQQNKGQPHLGKRFSSLAKSAPSPPSWESIHTDPMVVEATASLAAMQLEPNALAAKGAAIPIKKCSEIALELAWAKIHNDEDAIHKLSNEFQFSTCDPRWYETIETYIGYFKLGKASIPYRSGGDYVLDVALPATATIGIIGDWGTGSGAAQDLLRQVAGHKPDLVIHLGDIYYSGTMFECQTCFLDLCRAILPTTRVVTLSGNHDMYSAGLGYYWLVDQLQQKASYFCIQNADWQFLALDTGYHDFDPFSVNTNVTYLTTQEAAWHLDKIRNRGKRKTALFSHHQLFSAFEPIGGRAVNNRLLDQFKAVLPNVDIWLWGHEHRLNIYGPFSGLQRGRCLGCSAVPEFVEPSYFTPKFGDVPLQPLQIRNDGSTYDHAYAIMKLNGPKAEVAYYGQSAPAKPLFVEQI